MAHLGTRSWDTAMPETLAEAQIEFDSGLRAQPDCAQDLVSIAVPAGTVITPKPGCTLH